MNKDIDILLSKYFSGEASQEELHLLDHWLEESEKNEEYFNKMTSLFQQLGSSSPIVVNAEDDLGKFRAHMDNTTLKDKNKPVFKSLNIYRAVAASLILFIGISLFFLLRNQGPVQLASTNNELQYSLTKNIDVVLAPESHLSYKSGKKNEVELKGKATFVVENSKDDKELLIQVGETFIKDIGTTFTVTAYNPEDPVVVEVEKGEVLFYTQSDKGIHIKEKDKGIYDPKTKHFTYISMKELLGEIIFVDAFLNEVIHALEIRYDVRILLKPETLNKMQITASFDKNESVEDILKIIAQTLSLNITKNKEAYVISY